MELRSSTASKGSEYAHNDATSRGYPVLAGHPQRLMETAGPVSAIHQPEGNQDEYKIVNSVLQFRACRDATNLRAPLEWLNTGERQQQMAGLRRQAQAHALVQVPSPA
ncbi:hypothetical protein HIM_01521 [Hirsutella minnesotensis 3608]|nr:hypothetical protein HIM_01521 [Hirsutella minnesotensis 3608]